MTSDYLIRKAMRLIEKVEEKLETLKTKLRLCHEEEEAREKKDQFAQYFDELFAQTRYEEAALFAAESGILRTPDTVAKFQSVDVQAGQVPPLLQYFEALLTNGKLDVYESLELSLLVVNQNKSSLLVSWLAEDKLECCEELGDIVKIVDNDLAHTIYTRAGITPKVDNAFVERKEFDKTPICPKQSSCEARCSKSKAIDHFLAMGFDEEKIIKVIHEHGEENMEHIAHTLLSSAKDSVNINKLQSLVDMGFSKLEASLALQRCDENVGIAELADFICATQIARESEEFHTHHLEKQKVAPPQYQVFISFRGEQLRNNFISHLVQALKGNKINVFIDEQEHKGEDISNLLKRIEDSRIAVVVFSSKYTQSTWCLREAATIKDCAEQGMLKVLPIFYNVTTINVKQLKGEFGDNFRDRERESNKQIIERWKEALAFISGKLGLTFDERRSECGFIDSVVKEVLTLLASIPSSAQSVNS